MSSRCQGQISIWETPDVECGKESKYYDGVIYREQQIVLHKRQYENY